MTRSLQEQLDLLREASATVERLVPGARNYTVGTTDQHANYGFNLVDVETRDRESLGEKDPALLQKLSDEIDEYLVDLDWDGIVGEDAGGGAIIPIGRWSVPLRSALTRFIISMHSRLLESSYTQRDWDRAMVRVRKALQGVPNVHMVRKDRDTFYVDVLGTRGDLGRLAMDVRGDVVSALRELAPHTTLGVTGQRSGPTGNHDGYAYTLATNPEPPISVSIG